jgi:hypothetical protein
VDLSGVIAYKFAGKEAETQSESIKGCLPVCIILGNDCKNIEKYAE